MEDGLNPEPEIAHPVILYSLLSACKRHDGPAYRQLSDALSITVENVGKLVEQDVLLGSKPLTDALSHIARSGHYAAIAELAGRESFSHLSHRFPSFAHIDLKRALPNAFHKAVNASSRLLEGLYRPLKIGILRQRDSYFLEVRGSPFVSAHAIVPQCGFFSGFIKEAVRTATGHDCQMEEAVCAACDKASTFCIFTVSPPK